VPTTYSLKVLDEALFIWTFWVLHLGLPNQKVTLTTLNIKFHINLGRFV
jgi:hypothetical protein